MAIVNIPECPQCRGTAWSSTESVGGGERMYRLRPTGWELVDSTGDLYQTDYACDNCGELSPDDYEELWEKLSDID